MFAHYCGNNVADGTGGQLLFQGGGARTSVRGPSIMAIRRDLLNQGVDLVGEFDLVMSDQAARRRRTRLTRRSVAIDSGNGGQEVVEEGEGLEGEGLEGEDEGSVGRTRTRLTSDILHGHFVKDLPEPTTSTSSTSSSSSLPRDRETDDTIATLHVPFTPAADGRGGASKATASRVVETLLTAGVVVLDGVFGASTAASCRREASRLEKKGGVFRKARTKVAEHIKPRAGGDGLFLPSYRGDETLWDYELQGNEEEGEGASPCLRGHGKRVASLRRSLEDEFAAALLRPGASLWWRLSSLANYAYLRAFGILTEAYLGQEGLGMHNLDSVCWFGESGVQLCGRGIPVTCNFTMVASPMGTPPSSQSANSSYYVHRLGSQTCIKVVS